MRVNEGQGTATALFIKPSDDSRSTSWTARDFHRAAFVCLFGGVLLGCILVRGGRAATAALLHWDVAPLRWLESAGGRTEGILASAISLAATLTAASGAWLLARSTLIRRVAAVVCLATSVGFAIAYHRALLGDRELALVAYAAALPLVLRRPSRDWPVVLVPLAPALNAVWSWQVARAGAAVPALETASEVAWLLATILVAASRWRATRFGPWRLGTAATLAVGLLVAGLIDGRSVRHVSISVFEVGYGNLPDTVLAAGIGLVLAGMVLLSACGRLGAGVIAATLCTPQPLAPGVAALSAAFIAIAATNDERNGDAV